MQNEIGDIQYLTEEEVSKCLEILHKIRQQCAFCGDLGLMDVSAKGISHLITNFNLGFLRQLRAKL